MATLALVALALAYTPSRPPLINTRSDLAAPPAELEPTNGHAVLPMLTEFNEPLRLPARRAKQPGKPSLMKRCVAEATGTAFIALGLSTVSSLQLGLVASSFWVAFVIAMVRSLHCPCASLRMAQRLPKLPNCPLLGLRNDLFKN